MAPLAAGAYCSSQLRFNLLILIYKIHLNLWNELKINSKVHLYHMILLLQFCLKILKFINSRFVTLPEFAN